MKQIWRDFMKNIFGIGLGILILTSGASVYASSCGGGDHSHPTKQKMAMQIFDKADTNSDGFITLEEHDAAKLSKYGTKFDTYDTDKDKRISKEEYMTTFNMHHGDGSKGA